MQINNARKFDLQGINNFKNLKGSLGAAIYINLDLNIKVLYSPIQYTLSGLNIDSCEASVDGGALYLKHLSDLTIIDSNITNNKALKGKGGGIYHYCLESQTDSC